MSCRPGAGDRDRPAAGSLGRRLPGGLLVGASYLARRSMVLGLTSPLSNRLPALPCRTPWRPRGTRPGPFLACLSRSARARFSFSPSICRVSMSFMRSNAGGSPFCFLVSLAMTDARRPGWRADLAILGDSLDAVTKLRAPPSRRVRAINSTYPPEVARLSCDTLRASSREVGPAGQFLHRILGLRLRVGQRLGTLAGPAVAGTSGLKLMT